MVFLLVNARFYRHEDAETSTPLRADIISQYSDDNHRVYPPKYSFPVLSYPQHEPVIDGYVR
jgi:hypothetical protein